MSLFEIFQPGLKHLREEKDRQKTQVTYPTHGDEGPLGIDLDGGTAKITMPAKDDAGQVRTTSPAQGETAAQQQRWSEERPADEGHPERVRPPDR